MTRMPFWGQGDQPPPFWGHERVPKVEPELAEKAVEAGALLIDLGHPDDWLVGHLPHALLVEPELYDMEIAQIPKERPIIVGARDLGLEEEVVASLRQRGYDAAAMDGGVSGWTASGRMLHRADGTSTR
jgi:rhodanese-related sulfurtransferase